MGATEPGPPPHGTWATRAPPWCRRPRPAPDGFRAGATSRSARQPVFTVHAVPFRVNAVGAVFAPVQLPLKPKEAELPGAMAWL